MVKMKKNQIQQAVEDYKNLKKDEAGEKQRQEQEWSSVMHSTHKNMSEGAANAISIHKIKTNRQGKQSFNKEHHTPGHQIHKGPNKKK
jgi:hypothetical protein